MGTMGLMLGIREIELLVIGGLLMLLRRLVGLLRWLVGLLNGDCLSRLLPEIVHYFRYALELLKF